MWGSVPLTQSLFKNGKDDVKMKCLKLLQKTEN